MNAHDQIYNSFERCSFSECLGICKREIEKPTVEYYKFYPWFYKGKVEYERGNFYDSIKSFKVALKLAPNENQIWVSLACAYELNGKNKLAMRAFIKEVRLFPTNDFGWQKLGGFLTRNRRFRLAKKIFDFVDGKGGIDFTVCASEYALSLYNAGTLSEELRFYENLLKMNYKEKWIIKNYNELLQEIEKSHL
jgi:tetratricopeptide (TPR) repeat protein